MSGLREPDLGPIVGHTTDTTCRLWIRGSDPQDDKSELSSESRTLGVVTVIEKNGEKISKPPTYYFRLHREYDRTGVFNIGEDFGIGGKKKDVYKLEPDTQYTVRMGLLILDDPIYDDADVQSNDLINKLPEASAWREDLLKLRENKSEACFNTFPSSQKISDDLSFIVGSCRYPGLLWRVKHADRIFAPILKQFSDDADEPKPKFTLMAGDQIYADLLSRFITIGLADTHEEFQDRYHKAFGSTNMRKLLRHVPSYMILDDHEIEDNWTQDRIKDSAKRRLFNVALYNYMSYQWAHGPKTFGTRLYYKFNCGGYPFFVIDTRTQRYIDDIENSLDDNHLLGRPAHVNEALNQLDRLFDWLANAQSEQGNIPKFIVSSSVFVPNPMKARKGASIKHKEESDSWPGFPTTRKAILDHIIENNIQNVIFVSGDIHCSNLAQMTFTGSAGARIIKSYSITSSAFYWPFPFADGDPSNYVHDSTASDQLDSFELSNGITMNYRAWNFTQQDNFCRVDIDRKKKSIRIRAFDTWGDPVSEEIRDGKGKRKDKIIEDTLSLAKW